MKLTPLAQRIVSFAEGNGGTISAREALLDLDITSSSLTRRITEIELFGRPGYHYEVERERKVNSATRKRYTRYRITRIDRGE